MSCVVLCGVCACRISGMGPTTLSGPLPSAFFHAALQEFVVENTGASASLPDLRSSTVLRALSTSGSDSIYAPYNQPIFFAIDPATPGALPNLQELGIGKCYLLVPVHMITTFSVDYLFLAFIVVKAVAQVCI